MDSDRTPVVQALIPLMRAALGKVEARDMSDATGFYLDGVLFGILSGGRLHFRVDRRTRASYDAWEKADDDDADSGLFGRGGLSGNCLKFRVVPPFVLDSEDSMATWGKQAWEAAKRARKAEA